MAGESGGEMRLVGVSSGDGDFNERHARAFQERFGAGHADTDKVSMGRPSDGLAKCSSESANAQATLRR